MMPHQNFTTIAFDIGGVLGANYHGVQNYLQEKTSIPADLIASRLGDTNGVFRNTMRGTHRLEQYINAIMYDTDWDLDPNYLDLLIKNYITRPFPQSAIEVAKALKAQGYRLVIFSDNIREWISYIKTTEAGKFLELFDTQIYSYDIKALKTDEYALTYGFNKNGIHLDEVIFIDDREPCIKAAVRQHIFNIRYTNPFNLQAKLESSYGIKLPGTF